MYNNEVIKKFTDFDTPKDSAWVRSMVSQIILNAKPVISKVDYDKLKDVLFGQFPQTELDRVFTGKTMKRMSEKLSKNTVFFFERLRNSLIDERNQAELTVRVNSLDPEKPMKKKSDRELKENQKGIESLLNEVTQGNGMPPKKFTEDDYNGNMEAFDEMGYNEEDPDDLKDFFDNHWGLKAECYLNNAINPVLRVNEITSDYDKYMNDIFICLYNFSRRYVDELEGKIKIEHLYPYEVDILHADKSNNLKTSQAFNIRKSTNVRGFMRTFGSHFDFEGNTKELLIAALGSGRNGSAKYTGITEKGQLVLGDKTGMVIDYQKLAELPINYGYAEFKGISTIKKQYQVTKEGNIIPVYLDANTPEVPGSDVEITYEENTYYAYYLETSAITPTIIKWGKLYMQPLEGAEDEHSGFSIVCSRREGIPVAKVLEPFHNMIQVTFKMIEMLVNDVKSDGYFFNFESMLKVAEYLKNNSKDAPIDQKNGIDLFLKMVEESPNGLLATPETAEGDAVGGGNMGIQPRKNGLNGTTLDLMKVLDWAEAKAEKYLGIVGIELSEPNDGYKLSIENKKKTRAATSFIDFILLSHLRDISIGILNNVQDISHFKDIPAYKYLESLIGTKALEFIRSLKKSAHRYGLFVETFNNDLTLLEIRARAAQALEREQIDMEQYLFLYSISNPTQAAAYLSREKKKAIKLKREEATIALRQQDAVNEKQFQRDLAKEDRKGKWMKLSSDAKAAGFIRAAEINSGAQITAKQIQEAGQNERLAKNAENHAAEIANNATKNAEKAVI